MNTPPVTHGSAAVRIGGSALTYLLEQSARNGCTARVAVEAIILQHQGREGELQDKSSPGAAMLEATAAGVDPIEAAVQVALPKSKRKPREATGVGTPAHATKAVSRAVQRKARLGKEASK